MHTSKACITSVKPIGQSSPPIAWQSETMYGDMTDSLIFDPPVLFAPVIASGMVTACSTSA